MTDPSMTDPDEVQSKSEKEKFRKTRFCFSSLPAFSTFLTLLIFTVTQFSFNQTDISNNYCTCARFGFNPPAQSEVEPRVVYFNFTLLLEQSSSATSHCSRLNLSFCTLNFSQFSIYMLICVSPIFDTNTGTWR